MHLHLAFLYAVLKINNLQIRTIQEDFLFAEETHKEHWWAFQSIAAQANFMIQQGTSVFRKNKKLKFNC